MTDDQFKALCNTYGFAPSRALRELIDCAVARQEILDEVTAQRDALLEALKAVEPILTRMYGPQAAELPPMQIVRAAIKKVEDKQ